MHAETVLSGVVQRSRRALDSYVGHRDGDRCADVREFVDVCPPSFCARVCCAREHEVRSPKVVTWDVTFSSVRG